MLTGWAVCVVDVKFQLVVVVTSWLPTSGLLAYQSAMLRLNDWLLPSV